LFWLAHELRSLRQALAQFQKVEGCRHSRSSVEHIIPWDMLKLGGRRRAVTPRREMWAGELTV
jgi:hypothetical protein